MIDRAVFMLREQQQKFSDCSPQWMVAEQLMDICRREPYSAELIAKDLENESMSIAEAEKKIKAYADKHRSGNSACVSPAVAENVLREFYGLPADGSEAPARGAVVVDLMEFLR